MTRAVPYDEVTDPAQAEPAAAPLDQMLPGVPGALAPARLAGSPRPHSRL